MITDAVVGYVVDILREKEKKMEKKKECPSLQSGGRWTL